MFNSVKRARKIPDLISGQIRDSILDHQIIPGDRLPSERELVEQFQASRIAVREALKSLEESGFITIRSGAGAFVNEVTTKPLSRSLSSLLRFERTSVDDMTQARLVLEPSIARLAAENVTEEDLDVLEGNIHQTEEFHHQIQIGASAPPSSFPSITFHSLIARATHNSVINHTMTTLFEVLNEMTAVYNPDASKRLKISKRAVRYHRLILQALRNRDGEKAAQWVLDDIRQVQKGFLGK
jgi:GntR family transcriptional repressor for pyruvate dehydrogenase complex